MDQGFKGENMFSVKAWSKTTLHALAVVLLLFVGARAAYSQAALTGAIQFATDSTGAFTTDVWNTLALRTEDIYRHNGGVYRRMASEQRQLRFGVDRAGRRIVPRASGLLHVSNTISSPIGSARRGCSNGRDHQRAFQLKPSIQDCNAVMETLDRRPGCRAATLGSAVEPRSPECTRPHRSSGACPPGSWSA